MDPQPRAIITSRAAQDHLDNVVKPAVLEETTGIRQQAERVSQIKAQQAQGFKAQANVDRDFQQKQQEQDTKRLIAMKP